MYIKALNIHASMKQTQSVHKDTKESPSTTPAETRELWNEGFDIMKLGYNYSPNCMKLCYNFVNGRAPEKLIQLLSVYRNLLVNVLEQ